MTDIEYTNKIDVTLVKWMGRDGDIVQAARVSTQGAEAGKESGAGLIDYLMKNRHGSPFEHGAMTFLVTAPIFVWREHHRHRIGFSYNEESGRYKELEPRFYVPRVARTQVGKPGHYDIVESDDVELTRLMASHIEQANRLAYDNYRDMLSAGVAREVARMCLPVNIMSSCFVTCNPRSLMSFLSLRTHRPDATFPSKPQAEIELLAEGYEAHFSRLYPLTWASFGKNGRVAP